MEDDREDGPGGEDVKQSHVSVFSGFRSDGHGESGGVPGDGGGGVAAW